MIVMVVVLHTNFTLYAFVHLFEDTHIIVQEYILMKIDQLLVQV